MKTYFVGGDRNFHEKVQKLLNHEGIKDTHIFIGKDITPEELEKNAPDCEILVASPSAFTHLSKEHLDALPNLKFITTISVATDWIDVEAAKERGVIVSNEKGVNAEAVAEHCFGMILDLSKRITEADRGIREKGEYRPSPYLGMDIYGKTIGIIGLGDIGKKVARIAGGFNMRMVGMNKSGSEVEGVGLVDLDTLLKESDVIVVAVPYDNDTHDLLSTREFSLMKDGVILVSISREQIINKEATLKALDAGKLAGFGFDAEIMLKIPKDDPWLQYERVVVTPHTASVTKESDEGYASMTVENIKAFLGDNPIRVAN